MIKNCILLILIMIAFTGNGQKPRLLITTDIGGDPDDRQSLIRLMLYSCDFELEGIVTSAAGTQGELGKSIIRPDLAEEIIQGYGKVWPNLVKHNEHFPSPEYLLSVVKKGNPYRGWENIGEGHDSEGSEWIIRCIEKEDPRPLNIAIWGGQTDVVQALWKIKNKLTPENYKNATSRFRIHDIADQDSLFKGIKEKFPDLFYVISIAPAGKDKRNAAFRGMYLGGDESLTSAEWIRENVTEGHGPLGALYPMKTWTASNPHGVLKEGDTPSWFYFLENGLNAPAHPEYGGWGGRFEKTKEGYYTGAADSFRGETNTRATVYRWRNDFQREFAARMDWCVKEVADANHSPIIAVNGHTEKEPLVIRKKPGKKIRLDATGSTDPDGDNLRFGWFIYPETENFKGKFNLPEDGPQVEFRMPELEKNTGIHIILKGTDNGSPELSGYKRIILMNR